MRSPGESPIQMSWPDTRIETVGGATLSYRRVGGGARKILFYHGFPGSSLQVDLFRPFAESHGLDVICLDRPGFGQTQVAAGPQLELATEYSRRLVEREGWTGCEVFAVSGGAPFGLDFARRNPGLVRSTVVLSGLGPLAIPEFARLLSRRALFALRAFGYVPGHWIGAAVTGTARSGLAMDMALMRFFLPASAPDELVIGDAAIGKALFVAKQEAFSQRGLGPRRDAAAFLSPWGWEPEQFSGRVAFWHGLEDSVISAEMSRRLAARIPGARFHGMADEGHFSLSIRRIGEILEASVA
jgi:pimeloyl-ACP methyl ester carboxylesterase